MDKDLQSFDSIIHGDIQFKESFEVDTLKKANWCVDKILLAEQRIQKIKEAAKEYIEKINTWVQDATKKDEATLETMKDYLEPWVLDEIMKVKEKNVKLLDASAGFRSVPADMEIIKEDDVIEYCEANHPKCVKTEKKLLKSELRKVLKTKDIPGVTLDPQPDNFWVKENND